MFRIVWNGPLTLDWCRWPLPKWSPRGRKVNDFITEQYQAHVQRHYVDGMLEMSERWEAEIREKVNQRIEMRDRSRDSQDRWRRYQRRIK